MAKEVVSLALNGNIQSEFFGFHGKACLKQAAEIAQELEKLGIVADIAELAMKDTAEAAPTKAQQKVKMEVK